MTTNLFDYFEDLRTPDEASVPWTARSPRRPQKAYDLQLVPRSPQWQSDSGSLDALKQIECEPWVDGVIREAAGVRLRIADGWIEKTGAGLEAGGGSEAPLSDLAQGSACVRPVLGCERDQGRCTSGHLPQPRHWQCALGRARPGRRTGRATQPHLRHGPARWARRWRV